MTPAPPPPDPNKRPGPGPDLRKWEVNRIVKTAEKVPPGSEFQMEFGLDIDCQWIHDDLIIHGHPEIQVLDRGIGVLPNGSLGAYTPDSIPAGGGLAHKWVVKFLKAS